MRIVQLGDVVKINPRLPKETAQKKHARVSFLPMAGVSEGGEITTSEEREFGEVVKGYTYFEKGDVLLAKITPCFENGKSALVDDAIPHQIGFGSTEFHVLRASGNIDPRYLFYMVWNPAFRFVGERNMTGTAGQKRIPVDFLRRYKIPLPPLAEQKRIAAILDKADAIRRKRQAAIKLADDFLRATFLDMFGDPVTNPKGWETGPLNDFGLITTGNTPSRKKTEFYGDDIEWIKSDNINTPYHFLTKAEEGLSTEGEKVARKVSPYSTLVTCIAGSFDCIGNVALSDREVAFNQQINAITPREGIDPFFLYCLILNAKKIIQNASTNSMKGMVSKGKFEQILFFKPPIFLQQKFGSFFQNYIQKMNNIQMLEVLSGDLFNSLTLRTFRGEL